MKKNTDKTQATVLRLIFNTLHFEEWYVKGKLIGFKLKNDLGKEVRYCLNPKHFNTNLPPAHYWQAPIPSPEYHIRKLVMNHFDSIQKLISKNDWLYPSHSLDHPDGKMLSFSITGINSHFIICPYRLGDDDAISCYQLLELYKKEFVRKMIKKINSYLRAQLGDKEYRKLRSIPAEKRSLHYVRTLHNYID